MFPDIKPLFLLNPDITFLNFGSFGACPKPIFADYQHWQLKLEQEPVKFITKTGIEYLDASREALGKYVHADKSDLVYVTNPSYAVNMIAKSFPLQKGDEILTTDLEYGACDKTWQYYCDKAGAIYRRQPIHLPIVDEDYFVQHFIAAINSKTKLIFLSHITSVTGLRFPVEKICAIAKQKGILIFIDGAHAPGHIALNLEKLGADFYTGACHKWMMTPKGSSFLYVHKNWQHLIDPLVISWGYKSDLPSDSLFIDYHQLQGTRDFSAFLTIPKAIEFMEQHDWKNVAQSCHDVLIQNAPRFFQLLQTEPIAPLHSSFIAQMCSIPIRCSNPMQLKALLYDNYQIEIPVMTINGNHYLRISMQAFNTQHDLDILYNALQDIILNTSLIQIS